ncbi:MAG TPA: TetR/AcrR family transcriptional regulator [Streptosporangiaceae bacterium]
MNKNIERGQATRAHLIEVATRLFATRGYDDTSIEAVLAETGVSRGSLYHHFPGKEALFRAVMDAEGARLGAQMAAAIQGAADQIEMLRIGCITWIRQAGDPVVQQIMLIDAPAVLGWQRWRELDEPALGMIRNALGYAAQAGAVDSRHVDVFAHIVMATLNEVAMMIALASDSAAALEAGESAVAEFLDRLLGGLGSASHQGPAGRQGPASQ